MICFLPSSPGNAWVRRIDWMISRIFRSYVVVKADVGEEAVADELLGDRRGAAGVAGQRVDAGRDDADRVEAGVLPERLVLDRRRRVDHDRRDLVERDDVALLAGERRELDLAGPVVDRRLLVELDVVEDLLRVGEVLAVVRERAHRAGEADEAGDEERGEEEERDGDRDRRRRRACRWKADGRSRSGDGAAAARGWSAWRRSR